MSHWASSYLGIPWDADAHECGDFFRRVQRERFGREVEPYEVDANDIRGCIYTLEGHPENRRWVRVDKPQEGDAVKLGHGKRASHIGIWIDANGGGVLHCPEGFASVFEPLHKLRLSGWQLVEFYRYAG